MPIDTEKLRADSATGPAQWVRRQVHKACNEIDSLRARVAELEEENERLREHTKSLSRDMNEFINGEDW